MTSVSQSIVDQKHDQPLVMLVFIMHACMHMSILTKLPKFLPPLIRSPGIGLRNIPGLAAPIASSLLALGVCSSHEATAAILRFLGGGDVMGGDILLSED